MASQDQSYLRFGPLKYTDGWDMTTGPGVGPASCVVTFPESELAKLDGPIHDLVFLQGDRELFRVRDCHIVRARAQSNAGLVQCTIYDWRWRWEFGYIDGVYNIPRPDGSYIREKTPQELAALLLGAMGEKSPRVTRLPNDTRPQVNWQAARADAALSQLCHSLGCYVAPNYKSDRAEIHRIGEGEFPRNTKATIHRVKTLSVKALPGTVVVQGGPSLFQDRLKLEAMGEDVDGKIKPFLELSYIKPLLDAEEGKGYKWQYEVPWKFSNIEGTYVRAGKNLQIRDLAAASCYKVFRIKELAAGGFSPKDLRGTEYEPKRYEDLLPLRPIKLTAHTTSGGDTHDNPATVHGVFEKRLLDMTTVQEGTQYPGAFSIDGKSGLVTFQDHVFLMRGHKFDLPDLELDTSFPVSKDGVYVRYEVHEKNSNEKAFGEYRITIPELVSKVSYVEGDEYSNTKEIEGIGRQYLAQHVRRYRPVEGEELQLTRIHPQAVNGIVRQISWRGGGGRPSTTRISVNTEHNSYIPSYENDQYRRLTDARAEDLARAKAAEEVLA